MKMSLNADVYKKMYIILQMLTNFLVFFSIQVATPIFEQKFLKMYTFTCKYSRTMCFAYKLPKLISKSNAEEVQ